MRGVDVAAGGPAGARAAAAPEGGPSVRTAAPEDAASIAALGLAVWLRQHAASGFSDRLARYAFAAHAPQAVAAEIGDRSAYLPVAQENGRVQGYALLKTASPGLCHAGLSVQLAALCVHEPATGRGLGSRLLEACLEFARRRRLPPHVWVRVNARQRRVLHFFVRHRFHRAGSVWLQMDGEEAEHYVLVHERAD